MKDIIIAAALAIAALLCFFFLTSCESMTEKTAKAQQSMAAFAAAVQPAHQAKIDARRAAR